SLLQLLTQRSSAHRELHSFPTRRSSDLELVVAVLPLDRVRHADDARLPVAPPPLARRLEVAEQPRAQLARLAYVEHEPRRAEHRSEEHTSELQSLRHLVCRLLLEKKNSN